MRSRFFRRLILFIAMTLAGITNSKAGSVTLSHDSSALPDAPGPAITLASITGTNDGTNYTFTLRFFNPTIEGPSSNNSDAVFGFINLDTDKNKATGVSGAFLDSNSFEPGFGRYSPSSQGIDAYINLSSEGNPFLHPTPGLVDLVSTNGFNTVATVPVTYTSQVGPTQSMLTLSIPLTDFSSAQIKLDDTGNFSVIVGNANNATDFLAPASAVPEPGSVVLLVLGMSLLLLVAFRIKGRAPMCVRGHISP
jgi:hypothetical protein